MTEQPTVRQLHPTDLPTMADYGADCRDRLLGAGLPPTLHGAASCAGRQLEWLKPLVVSLRSDGGLMMGLAAHVERRNLLVVIADAERVVVQPIRPTTSVAAMCDGTRTNVTARYGAFSSQYIPGILRTVLHEFGHKPARALSPSSDVLLDATGVLLAAQEVQDLAPELDRIISQEICPVLVDLLGPATSGRPDLFSAVWPVPLLLAPYRDALLAGFPQTHKKTT
jgi:hypothetical protein